MAENERPAEEILAHSEDADEWEDAPEQIESRPAGTQVISARLPTGLAEELFNVAAERGVRPSELVRDAVQAWLRAVPSVVVDIRAFAGQKMHVSTSRPQASTENLNLVVEVEADPASIEIREEVSA